MEWLAYESMVDLKQTLKGKNLSLWSQFPQMQIRAGDRVQIDIGLGFHKLVYDGLKMQSKVAGANDRADFCLVCRKANSESGQTLCTVYHTTHFAANTHSTRSHAIIFESRLLFRGCLILCDIMDTVIQWYGVVVGREPFSFLHGFMWYFVLYGVALEYL